MRIGKDQRGERLTDDQAIFALVLGIVKLAPQHDQYQFGGYSLKYHEYDNSIGLELLSPKDKPMFRAKVELAPIGEDTKAKVWVQYPDYYPTPPEIKEVRTAMRKMVLAVTHHDYAESRSEKDESAYVERYI